MSLGLTDIPSSVKVVLDAVDVTYCLLTLFLHCLHSTFTLHLMATGKPAACKLSPVWYDRFTNGGKMIDRFYESCEEYYNILAERALAQEELSRDEEEGDPDVE